jgi:hypothetical protein
MAAGISSLSDGMISDGTCLVCGSSFSPLSTLCHSDDDDLDANDKFPDVGEYSDSDMDEMEMQISGNYMFDKDEGCYFRLF